MLHLPLSSFPVLETERLLLREIVPTDASDLFVLRSDPEVNKYIERKKPLSADDALLFVERVTKGIGEGNSLYWVICGKERPGVIGTICLWNIVPEKDLAEVGYELFPAFHGKGIMQEALAVVLDFASSVLRLRQITAFTHGENVASLRLLARNGFRRDTALESVTDMNAEAPGAVIYSLEMG